MKHITTIFRVLLCLTFCGCETWMEDHIGRTIVNFQNNAEYEISVCSALIPPYDSSVIMYPDTSLPLQMPRVVNIRTGDYQTIFDARTDLGDVYAQYRTDTISLYVFSTELLSTVGWDSLRTTYSVLQRYDICLNDFRLLHHYPTFPPTEEMRNIKMWPPYGTYDSMGFPIQ